MIGFIRRHLLYLLMILGLSVWSLWPILKDPSRRTADSWDGVLMVWYLNQTIEKIPGKMEQIFQGNIFYPYKNTMAYSDMMVLSAIVSYIPVKISNEPVVAVSAALLFGQITTIFILYLWFYELFKVKSASFLAAVALGLSATRLGFIVHLQMWNMQWFLFSSYMFFKFVKSGKKLYSYLSFVFLGLQMWESPLGVYFGLFLDTLTALFNKIDYKKEVKTLCISLLLFIIIAILPAGAYMSVSREFGYTRSIRDAAHFSMGMDQIFERIIIKPIFFVFLFSLFTIRKEIKRNSIIFWSLIVSFSALVLSLGPVLKWAGKTVKIFGLIPIPLPYAPLYYLIPGFKAFRTPDRWVWIVILGMSFVVAAAVAKFLSDKKTSTVKKILVVAIIISVSLMDGRVKNFYSFQKVGEYPKVYSVLKDQPEGVILELPVFGWAAGEIASIETHRMVYSLYHGKHMLGGASGFNPPTWDKMMGDSWNAFPSVDFEKRLKELNVNYLLVWKNLYESEKIMEIEKWGKNAFYEDDDHMLFLIK